MIDDQEYALGKGRGPSQQYFLHPLESFEDPGLAHEFYDEDYFGEAC